ncbi:MAG: hypothetical protein KGH98_00540 [Candidatus Micrarchaeota archaeon]|nr:hypothetical protein [Candidatus Micrarchaeota archaeon]
MISVLVIGKYDFDRVMDLALAARALGASGISFCFDDKKRVEKAKISRKMGSIAKEWGGTFKVEFPEDWKEWIGAKKNYKKIYLTMYGVPMRKLTYTLRTYKNILLVVTTNKPLKDLFGVADFNISITNQPHTSVSSVAVFLYEFYKEREPAMKFENAKVKVVPTDRGMMVEKV